MLAQTDDETLTEVVKLFRKREREANAFSPSSEARIEGSWGASSTSLRSF
ncbi:MAG: hypothetical protein ACTS6G_03755 [Candidatus Hodgkinia cicadicola]